LQIRPGFESAHYNMAMALESLGRSDEAIAHFQEAVRIKPDWGDALELLAADLGKQGRSEEAVARYRDALRLRPNKMEVLNNLAWILATSRNPKARDGTEAVRLAQRARKLEGSASPNTLDTLAAAYAEAGRFEEAVQTEQKALALALSLKQEALISVTRVRLQLYESRSPYRE